ncbi:hypothetical protein Ddc_21773 [Ditylenchus destructor]|nr:hypothetical protein Ddc_21773 [Ditylenchus destructor]
MFGSSSRALGRKHLPVLRQSKVAWRAVYQPSAEALLSIFSFWLTAGCTVPAASAALVRLPSSTEKMNRRTLSRSII